MQGGGGREVACAANVEDFRGVIAEFWMIERRFHELLKAKRSFRLGEGGEEKFPWGGHSPAKKWGG